MTIEEMLETFTRASRPQLIDYLPSDFDRAGLLAVIEKHVGPMIAESFDDALFGYTSMDGPKRANEARNYAARIIAQLKGTP